MIRSTLPSNLEDKIFEIKYNSDETISKITSYFPFSESERKEILLKLNYKIDFHSIFTDSVSEDEWEKTKIQIKKKFNDELFDIDRNL